MKYIVEHEGWECAESVELNIWVQLFGSNQHHFLPGQLGSLGKQPSELFSSIAQIRHTAVYRLRITTVRLEELMLDAEALARLLCDDDRVRKLERLRRELQLTVGELKCNKDLLEAKLNSKLRKIAGEREELDRLEHMAVEEMLREDKEYRALAGASLNEAIHFYETAVHSEAPTEVDSKSEADADTDAEAGSERPAVDVLGD